MIGKAYITVGISNLDQERRKGLLKESPEEVDDGAWSVHVYDVLLARLDKRTMILHT